MRMAVQARLHREQAGLDGLRSRPVLAYPQTMIESREQEIGHIARQTRHLINEALLRAAGDVGRLAAQVRTLSPASTLERGYAVVQLADGGAVLREPSDAPKGTALRLRLAQGELAATAD